MKKRGVIKQLFRDFLCLLIKHEKFINDPKNIDYLIYEIQERNKISYI